MRVELTGDELLVVIDVSELPYKAAERSLAARLPRSAPDIATEVVGMLDTPKPASEPATVRAVTVKIVRTVVISSETLMLDTAREIYT